MLAKDRMATMKTMCLGDSLTAGNPGRSFVRYLPASWGCVNRGIGGETLLGLLGRVERNPPPEGEMVIVETGGNDLLLPYMHENRPAWRSFVETIYRNGMRVSETEAEFESNYRRLAELLAQRSGRLLCVGLPMLGEQEGSALNSRAAAYADIVARVARDSGADFVDLHGWQRSRAGGSPYLLGEMPDSLAADAVALREEGAEAAACRARGLEITVDGVHLNKRGAEGLAAMIVARFEGPASSHPEAIAQD